MNPGPYRYVLITPARNEERLIEDTIRSVISQTLLPTRWVVVSDASTDRTDEIVRKYLPDHPWMSLVRMPEHRDRNFGAKVQCFKAGLESIEDDEFEILGNLDADITFGPDYFEFLMAKFAADPTLGVGGTPFVEDDTAYDFRFSSVEHVSGACQMFRRECYDEIGGYVPIAGGGIDTVAVRTARMKGWRTRTFVERVCHHHRPMGTATVGKWKALVRLGKQDYYLGGHPLWQLLRAAYQAGRKPYLVGGLLLLLGYFRSLLAGTPRQVSPELQRFHQREQMSRLRQRLSRITGFRAITDSEASSES